MQKEITKAVLEAQRAMNNLTAVALLPQTIGARIKWRSNGLVWERLGDDQWWPLEDDGTRQVLYYDVPEGKPRDPWPSAHLGGDWDLVKP